MTNGLNGGKVGYRRKEFEKSREAKSWGVAVRVWSNKWISAGLARCSAWVTHLGYAEDKDKIFVSLSYQSSAGCVRAYDQISFVVLIFF